MTRRVSRRDFIKATAIGAGGAFLASCAPAATPTAQVVVPPATAAGGAAPPVTIEVLWENWGELFNKKMSSIGDAFTKDAAPNITVKWDFAENNKEKLLASVAAGTPPDATITSYIENATYAAKGTFMPLDDLLAEAGLGQKDFVPGMWDTSIWEGKLYAIPGGADAKFLVYSKDVYRDAGLDPEAPPKTVDEFREHALKILKKDAQGNIERLGYAPIATDMRYWVPLWGGDWYDPATKKVTANSPKVVEAWQWVLDYANEIGLDKVTAWMDANPGIQSEASPFCVKKEAFFSDGWWVYDTLDTFAPKIDYGVAAWPTLHGIPEERKNWVIQGWMLAIPKGSKHVNEAWQFIKYGFVDQAWAMACRSLNGISVPGQMAQMSKCVKEEILGTTNRMVPYFDIYNEMLSLGTKHWPVMTASAFYWDEMKRIYDFVIRGQKQVKEALDELTESVQKELDKGV